MASISISNPRSGSVTAQASHVKVTLSWVEQSYDPVNKTTTINYTLTFTRSYLQTSQTKKYSFYFGDQVFSGSVAGGTITNNSSSSSSIQLTRGSVVLNHTIVNGKGQCQFNFGVNFGINATLSSTVYYTISATGSGSITEISYSQTNREITQFNIFRCDTSGIENNDGEKAKINLSLSLNTSDANASGCYVEIYYQVNSAPTYTESTMSVTNYSGSATLSYGSTNFNSAINGTLSIYSGSLFSSDPVFSKGNNYYFLVIFREVMNGNQFTPKTARATLTKASMVMHLAGNSSGGVSFGQYSTSTEENPKFECNYPAYFYNRVNSSSLMPGDSISFPDNCPVGNGYISNDMHDLHFTIHLGTPLTLINSISLSGRFYARGSGTNGYSPATPNGTPADINSSWITQTTKIVNSRLGIVYVLLRGTGTWGFSNNTPISISSGNNGYAPFTLTFS